MDRGHLWGGAESRQRTGLAAPGTPPHPQHWPAQAAWGIWMRTTPGTRGLAASPSPSAAGPATAGSAAGTRAWPSQSLGRSSACASGGLASSREPAWAGPSSRLAHRPVQSPNPGSPQRPLPVGWGWGALDPMEGGAEGGGGSDSQVRRSPAGWPQHAVCATRHAPSWGCCEVRGPPVLSQVTRW